MTETRRDRALRGLAPETQRELLLFAQNNRLADDDTDWILAGIAGLAREIPGRMEKVSGDALAKLRAEMSEIRAAAEAEVGAGVADAARRLIAEVGGSLAQAQKYRQWQRALGLVLVTTLATASTFVIVWYITSDRAFAAGHATAEAKAAREIAAAQSTAVADIATARSAAAQAVAAAAAGVKALDGYSKEKKAQAIWAAALSQEKFRHLEVISEVNEDQLKAFRDLVRTSSAFKELVTERGNPYPCLEYRKKGGYYLDRQEAATCLLAMPLAK